MIYKYYRVHVEPISQSGITLEWADSTAEDIELTVYGPLHTTSNKQLYKLLHFNCTDSNGDILDVNVDNNFVDESSVFDESIISLSILGGTGTHTLQLLSNVIIPDGRYRIGVEYNDKRISATINIDSVHYQSYSSGLANLAKYILSPS